MELFRYQDREVRTVTIDGDPGFVHADVCAVLEIGNPSDALHRLDDDERGVVSIDGPNGRRLDVNIITEAGLYSLILGSRKPQAKPFKRWVTHDVLPAIRRTGSYGVPAPRAELSRMELIEIAHAAETERLALAAKVAELEPKAAAADALTDVEGALSIGAVGNMLGIGRNNLFKMLYQEKILQPCKRPYQDYADWFRVVTTTREVHGREIADYTAYIFPAGALRLHHLLVHRGYTLRKPAVAPELHQGLFAVADGDAS